MNKYIIIYHNSKSMNKKSIISLILVILLLLIVLKITLLSTTYQSLKEGLDDTTIPSTGIIPDGYYKINDTTMKKIPYGYTTNENKTELLPNTQATFWKEYVKDRDHIPDDPLVTNTNTYNVNNYDVEYHDHEETIKSQSGVYGSSFGTTMVLDNCGNKLLIPYTKSQGFPTYYTPGTYKYGANTYVPNYEESIYLSKMNRNNNSYPLIPSPSDEKSKIQYNNISTSHTRNIVYLKPEFISLSTYMPNSEYTLYSSKTSGIDTTSKYC